jgi:hypothetical protein
VKIICSFLSPALAGSSPFQLHPSHFRVRFRAKIPPAQKVLPMSSDTCNPSLRPKHTRIKTCWSISISLPGRKISLFEVKESVSETVNVSSGISDGHQARSVSEGRKIGFSESLQTFGLASKIDYYDTTDLTEGYTAAYIYCGRRDGVSISSGGLMRRACFEPPNLSGSN